MNLYQLYHRFKENIPTIKTLGVLWLAEDDVFSFQVEEVLQPQFTKRFILSRVSKVFDPLGLYHHSSCVQRSYYKSYGRKR
jgi:hypothetical protein